MLDRCLKSIAIQKTSLAEFQIQIEVVVSDHSFDSMVKEVCLDVSSDTGMNLIYLQNNRKRGSSSANLNDAYKASSGQYVKILFQDDFFTTKTAIVDSLDLLQKSGSSWLVSSSTHTLDGVSFFSEHLPRYHDQIHLGNNTISSPSVLLLERNAWLDFDERLIWFMDVDLYKRLGAKFGPPAILETVTVANGLGPHQVTNTRVTRLRRLAEKTFVWAKSNIQFQRFKGHQDS